MSTQQTSKPRRTGDKEQHCALLKRDVAYVHGLQYIGAPCRSYYPDTATLSDAQMRGHYVLFGRKEHRIHRRLRVWHGLWVAGLQPACDFQCYVAITALRPVHDCGVLMPRIWVVSFRLTLRLGDMTLQ